MKKISFLFFLTLLPLMANAYDALVDGIYYNFDTNTKEATVTYYSMRSNKNAYTGSVTIPASVTYNDVTYSVTSIGEYALRNCSSLTSVTIPSSVTTIGSQAFRGCSGLTSVTIPGSVTFIGENAFYECTSLTSVEIPSSVASIEAYTFYGCSSLTSVTVPNSVSSIGKFAFQECSSLTSVTIGNSVTEIGVKAFTDCPGLTSVTINSNAIASQEYSSDSNIGSIFGSQVTEYVLGGGCAGNRRIRFPGMLWPDISDNR